MKISSFSRKIEKKCEARKSFLCFIYSCDPIRCFTIKKIVRTDCRLAVAIIYSTKFSAQLYKN